MIDKVSGMFTGMLTGYLIGMVVGFTVFDPEWDVWALLGLVLALVGLVAGLLPVVRRNRSVILGAIIGFYLGWLLNFLVFGDVNENGMDLFQNGIGGFLCTTLGLIAGAWLGSHYRSQAAGYALFAATFGGFFGGLVIGTAFSMGEGTSMLEWAIPVILTGSVIGLSTWWWQTQRRHTGSALPRS